MKYKNAEIVDIADIERGDIIVYQNPKTGEEKLGIMYNAFITKNDDGSHRRSGFTVVPVVTVGRERKPTAPFALMENDAASVVEQAGGNPDLQKIILQMNLSRVVNLPVMTGLADAGKFRVIGSYNGSPLMKEIYEEVETLYRAGKLYRDGKPVGTEQTIAIVSPVAATRDAKDNSAARRDAYQNMEGQTSTAPLAPIVEKARKAKTVSLAAMSLSEAFDKGMISHSTNACLADAVVPGTKRAPKTLGEAYDIVVKAPDSLLTITGLASKGKMYQRLVSEVTAALEPPTSTPG